MIVNDGSTSYNLVTIKVVRANYFSGLQAHFSDPAEMKAEADTAKEDGPRIQLIDIGDIDPTLLGDEETRVPQSGYSVRIEGDDTTMVVEFILKGWGRRDLKPGEKSKLEQRINMRQKYAIAASDRRAKQELARPIVVAVPQFEIMTEAEAVKRGLA